MHLSLSGLVFPVEITVDQSKINNLSNVSIFQFQSNDTSCKFIYYRLLKGRLDFAILFLAFESLISDYN